MPNSSADRFGSSARNAADQCGCGDNRLIAAIDRADEPFPWRIGGLDVVLTSFHCCWHV